jgi:hypothetical protein
MCVRKRERNAGQRMSRLKNLLFWFIALFITGVVAFVAAEVLCRILPLEDAFIRISRQGHNVVGFTRIPGEKTRSRKLCFDINPIKFNSLGLRSKEFKSGEPVKVAILGDSYMESLEIPEGLNTAGIMDRLLKGGVMNVSVSGYGTVTQLIAYRHFVKSHKPQAVVLFFLAGNDVKDNSCTLTELYGESIAQPCGYFENGKIRWRTTFDKTGSAHETGFIKPLLRKYCVSCNVAYRFIKFDLLRKAEHGELDFLYNTFRSEVPEQWRKDWKDGWKITEQAILDLKQEVESAGGKFLFVSIPSTLAVSPDWQDQLKKWSGLKELPDDLDPNLPDRWLDRFSKEHGIRAIKLAPIFHAYMNKFSLGDPHLWFFCDGHWNPVGHFIVANEVTEYLIENDMIKMGKEKKAALEGKISRNLDLDPMAILGKEAYDQIYGNRAYTGSSNIGQVFKGW